MTEQQLKQAQELKRTITLLAGELEKFNTDNPSGFNVYLPNVGELIDDVKQVFDRHLSMYNEKFRKL